MRNAYKLYFLKNKITSEDWQKIFNEFKKASAEFSLIFELKENNLICYLLLEKDLPPVLEKIDFILFKKEKNLPDPTFSDSTQTRKALNLKKYKNLTEFLIKTKQKGEIKLLSITKQHILKLFPFYKLSLIFQENEIDYKFTKLIFSGLENFLELDFGNKYLLQKEPLPICLDIAKNYEILGQKTNLSLLKINAFPFSNKDFYLNLNSFDFLKHSLIIGQTGVGKSKFIQLLIDRLSHFSEEYSVVLIDPHASIEKNLNSLNAKKISFDFINHYCQLFPEENEPKISTELTLLLFKTLLSQSFNNKLERILKYSLYLLFKQKQMDLETLKKFLTDVEFKNKVLEKTEEDFLKHFFQTEFIEIITNYYDTAVVPILSLIDEMSFIPAFSKKQLQEANLEEAIENNFLVSFPLERIYLGEKATQLIAGLIIQQVFLISQKRKINKKIILIIDEVSTVENEALISILSEARKFNLGLYLAQQYLTQVSQNLLRAILSNVYNFFVFKVSDEEAKIISSNLEIELSKILSESKEEQKNLKKQLFVNLNPREVIARVFANGKFYPAIKGETLFIS
ncbi:MAG: hypothetical protein KatS3mg090_0416 [Patescibacteria group bacterium]|nr:MAG: hypothetical protein KatS3mg090_0416 [Patescibacteria group bacterium]